MTSLGPDCPFLGEAGVAMGRVMTPGDQALCGGTRGDTRHQGAATCRRLHADQAEPGVRKGVPETCCGEAENPGQVGCWLCACVRACVRACVCVVCNWYVYVELHSMSSVGVADVCVVCLVCVRWEVPGV